MSRRISLIHHDYCPYLEEQHGVRVEYAEFSMLGATSPFYKILSYSCDCSDDCPCIQQDGQNECPVFSTAPEDPF